jgi:hypothetical protein
MVLISVHSYSAFLLDMTQDKNHPEREQSRAKNQIIIVPNSGVSCETHVNNENILERAVGSYHRSP